MIKKEDVIEILNFKNGIQYAHATSILESAWKDCDYELFLEMIGRGEDAKFREKIKISEKEYSVTMANDYISIFCMQNDCVVPEYITNDLAEALIDLIPYLKEETKRNIKL